MISVQTDFWEVAFWMHRRTILVKKFSCDHCTKSFLEVGSFKVHMGNNAGEKFFHVTSAQVIF